MGKLLAFPEKQTPHLFGTARCLSCKHEWASKTPEGIIVALECPSCGLMHGVLLGVCEPEHGTRWVCRCGCDLFYILPSDGCQCLMCGLIAKGF